VNYRQARILELLRERPSRDLYEGAAPNGRDGSGFYWVTYSAGVDYRPLSQTEVDELERGGLIVKRWPGCYGIATTVRRSAL
jgi:hypothetical protein